MIHSKSTDIALLLLRVTFGGLMIVTHGWGKLLKFFQDEPLQFADPIGLGVPASLALTVFAEVFCAVLVVVGLFTRWAVIPLIITMLVAIFIVNLGEPLQKLELAILYLITFTALGFTGPGWYSLDVQMRKL